MKVRLGQSSNNETLQALLAKELCIVYGREEADIEGNKTIYLTVKPRKENKECA